MSEKRSTIKVDTGSTGIKKVEVAYPSNAKTDKAEVVEERKVQKVVKSGVKKRKKPLGKKFMETFVGEEVDNVKSYIIHDVLIPAAKDTITDMVQGGIEMLLFGERKSSRGRGGSRNYSGSRVSYNSYSDDRRKEKRDISHRDRARHNFDEVVLESRGEAEEVLDRLVDLVIDYGEATVADLYDLVGITGNFTDNKYGWRDLSSASVSRVRDGYLLNLPKVRLLD